MKLFSATYPSVFLPRRPQEDYLLVSKKYPIFTVADGVSLNFKKGEKYPNPSGAAEVAKILCQTVVSRAEKKYDGFKAPNLKEVFKSGNKLLAEYNASWGRTKETINYFDKDFFSATTAFLLIKEKKAYWYSLCDSGIIFFNKDGRTVLNAPVSPPTEGKFLPEDWKNMNSEERAKVMHKYRNRVGSEGELLGYGVADGEEDAVKYLNLGAVDLNDGDLVLVYTDGFEEYIKLAEFNKMFIAWPDDLEKRLDLFINKMSKKSKKKYGLEKSLVAVKVQY